MRRFSHFMLVLASSAFASTLMGCAAPNQSLNETPAGEGGESGNSRSSQVHTWVNVTYVVGQALLDDDTWVGGDTDGSSFLVIRDKSKKRTTWVFLNGNYMSLHLPGVRPERITGTPGVGITTHAGDWSVNAASPFHERKLTYYLRNLYEAFQVLHVPFLTGEGWYDPSSPAATNGARADDAEWILARMGLKMRRIGANQTGKVLRQVPAGGKPVSVGTTVRVWLDGSRSMVMPGMAPPGDTFNPAIPIDHQGTVSAEITEDYRDTLSKASCDPVADGKEIFWQLPLAAVGMEVTARLLGPDKRVAMSAWKGDPPTPIDCDDNTVCCAYGRNRTITFLADSTLATYIVIDMDPDRFEGESLSLEMEISWRSP